MSRASMTRSPSAMFQAGSFLALSSLTALVTRSLELEPTPIPITMSPSPNAHPARAMILRVFVEALICSRFIIPLHPLAADCSSAIALEQVSYRTPANLSVNQASQADPWAPLRTIETNYSEILSHVTAVIFSATIGGQIEPLLN